jgi:hypothetical protein
MSMIWRERRKLSKPIPAWWFNFDHIGTEVCKQDRTERPSERHGAINNGHVFQRPSAF